MNGMRIIAHLDMDAFFAAVEERDNPRFKGLPIVVGADPEGGKGRGVVSTANYAARAYGIRSALPIGKAWEYSEKARKKGKPPAVFLGGNYEKYADISGKIMKLVRAHVPQTEQVSVDEAFLDLSFTGSYKEAQEFTQELKAEIKMKEDLTASVGIGPNKLVAKIASDIHKPDGLTVVEEKDVEAFLEPMGVRSIPGIGPKAEAELLCRGIRTVRDLRKLSRDDLHLMFGKWGCEMYTKARGKDETPVEESGEIKSIGEQETFREDTRDLGLISERLKSLSTDVWRRFSKSGFKRFRTVTLTVRFHGFVTKNRSQTFEREISGSDELTFEVLRMFMPFLDARENPGGKAIRLVGVRVEKLE